MSRPKIKDYYDIVPEAEDRYQVRSSELVSILRGATVKDLLCHLFPLLDGEHTTEEIASELKEVASPEVIHAVIGKLRDSRLLEYAFEPQSGSLTPQEVEQYRRQLIFLDMTLDMGTAIDYQARLKESRLAIIGEGELASSIASQAARFGMGRIFGVNIKQGDQISGSNPLVSFMAAGADLADMKTSRLLLEQEKPTCILIALDRPEPSLMRSVNEMSQDLGISLFSCQLNGTEGIVGPFIVPGQTACLMCHHLRVTRNLDFYQEYRSWEDWISTNGKRRAQTGALIPFTEMVAGMAALELFKHASGFHEPETYGRYITINALTLEIIIHQVLKLPRCPACGTTRNRPVFSAWQGV
jgi:bacteriocin biosynthesis cyclodehydratase domain-containing protein